MYVYLTHVSTFTTHGWLASLGPLVSSPQQESPKDDLKLNRSRMYLGTSWSLSFFPTSHAPLPSPPHQPSFMIVIVFINFPHMIYSIGRWSLKIEIILIPILSHSYLWPCWRHSSLCQLVHMTVLLWNPMWTWHLLLCTVLPDSTVLRDTVPPSSVHSK